MMLEIPDSTIRAGSRSTFDGPGKTEHGVMLLINTCVPPVTHCESSSGQNWGTQTMRLHPFAFLALLIAPVLVAAQGNLGTYEDRVAVEDVMARYVWAVDSLDPEGYVAVFTDDAVIDSNGSISKGHEEIRKIVTGLIQRRDDNKAKGLPPSNLHHVISNVRITFPKPGEALHQSYWQTVIRDKDGKMIPAAMGRSEDRLVKRNGKWLIQRRTLTVFTD